MLDHDQGVRSKNFYSQLPERFRIACNHDRGQVGFFQLFSKGSNFIMYTVLKAMVVVRCNDINMTTNARKQVHGNAIGKFNVVRVVIYGGGIYEKR